MRPKTSARVVAFVSVLASALFGQSRPAETAEARDARMAWWREARFGMFIHWGLYAIPAGTWKGKRIDGIGEWIMHSAKVPGAEYEPLVKQFNPVKFDAAQWARIAASAGMKYVVITSKHHDGFCLFDSKLTDYDVASTPFGRDVLKELAEACRKEGLRLGFYHSIMDWHHPDYVPRRSWDSRPGGDLDRYVAHLKGQLQELLTGYGDVGVLWFDGEWEDSWTHARGADLAAYVRGLKPSIIINNRVDKGRAGMAGLTKEGDYAGDFGTPEQEVPAKGFPGVDWESCMTMNDTWGYKSYDQNWKPASKLVETLVDIASKGGNLLLNVGPTSEGLIPAPSVERLQAMGRWLAQNGEAVYGTTATPFPDLQWRCTKKPGRLYVYLTGTVPASIDLPLASKVTAASILSDPARRPLPVERTASGVRVTIDGAGRDALGIVVAVDVEGTPR